MSCAVILDKIGFCHLLCAFDISCAEKITILNQNKIPAPRKVSSEFHLLKFVLGG